MKDIPNTKTPSSVVARACYFSDGTVLLEAKDPALIASIAKMMRDPDCEWKFTPSTAEGAIAFKAPSACLAPRAKKKAYHGKGFQKGHGALGGPKGEAGPTPPPAPAAEDQEDNDF